MAELIDKNELLKVLIHRVKGNEDNFIVLGTNNTLSLIEEWVRSIPTVDAVSFEQYYELRENFIDYVCCGVTNPAPFCKNRCAECVNNYGWCKSNDKCRGFNPDGERKTK